MSLDETVFEPLGETVTFRDAVPVADLNKTFNEHRVAVRALKERVAKGALTEAELVERMGKMEDDLRVALRADRAGTVERFVAGGDHFDLDYRYIRDDGTVRFRSERVNVPGPDGNALSVERPGLLDDRHPATGEHAALAEAFHRYALGRILYGRMSFPSNLGERAWVDGVIPAMKRMPGQTGAFLRSMLSDPALFKRVLNSTSGTGGEFISNPTIGVRRPISMPRNVSSLFRRQMAPSKTFSPVIATGRGLMRGRGAITTDPARFTQQSFTTAGTTVTVQDFVINCLIDSNLVRDSAPVADILMLIDEWINQAEIDTLEMMILHGDTAGTHMDSAVATSTWGGYFTAGQTSGSDNPLAKWLGLRARAQDDTALTSAGGAFTVASLTTPNSTLNAWDAGARILVGLNGIYTVSATSQFVTQDTFGPRAANVAGAVGVIGGKTVVLSEFLPKIFDTTTGCVTGSNAGNLLIVTNPNAAVVYEMDSPDGDYDTTQPQYGARYIGRNYSGVLAFNVATGEKPVAALYNIG